METTLASTLTKTDIVCPKFAKVFEGCVTLMSLVVIVVIFFRGVGNCDTTRGLEQVGVKYEDE